MVGVHFADGRGWFVETKGVKRAVKSKGVLKLGFSVGTSVGPSDIQRMCGVGPLKRRVLCT